MVNFLFIMKILLSLIVPALYLTWVTKTQTIILQRTFREDERIPGRRLLLGILGDSPNPDSVSDQKM